MIKIGSKIYRYAQEIFFNSCRKNYYKFLHRIRIFCIILEWMEMCYLDTSSHLSIKWWSPSYLNRCPLLFLANRHEYRLSSLLFSNRLLYNLVAIVYLRGILCIALNMWHIVPMVRPTCEVQIIQGLYI